MTWANENGIVLGVGNGRFDPNGVITRGQIATILYRYAQLKGEEPSMSENELSSSYADIFEVSEYAQDSVNWACSAGMLNGVTENGAAYFPPREGATRAQICTILMRCI